MTERTDKTYTVVEVLAKYPDAVCDLAMELREFVRGVVPKARETVRREGFFYTRPGERGFVKADVCRIAPQDDCVRLSFVHGAFLPDPKSLLQGEPGRLSMRFVKLQGPDDIRPVAMRALIRASFKHRPGAR